MKPFDTTWRCVTCTLLVLFCLSCLTSKAQNAVVIGGNTPNPNAVLLLVGNGSQGLVIPVTTDHTSITKVQGMIVFNKTDNNVYYTDGSSWKSFGGASSSTPQTLTISGNAISISNGNNITVANIAPTQPGQLLMWDGSKWTSSSSVAPTTTGQVLKWNNTTKSWEAGADAGGTSYVAGTGISITGSTIASTGNFAAQDITTTGKTILNSVPYTWPGVQGGANTYLKNDGAGNVTWATVAGGVSNVSGTAPVTVVNGSSTPLISMSQASTSVDGYLGKTDWTTFNGKLDAASTPSAGDITGSYTAGLQIGAGAISNADVNAAAAIAGTKINPDFGAQNITTTGKTILNTVSYTWPGTQGAASTYLKNDGAGNVSWTAVAGGVSNVSGTAPVTVVNGSSTPLISMSQASTSVDGYLGKTDWTTFNGKLDAASTPSAGDITGSYTAGLQIGAGAISNADVNAAAAIAGTKINPDFGAQNITTTGKTILNTVSYTWPGTQGAASTYLKNDGAGNVSWTAVAGGVSNVSGTAPVTVVNGSSTPLISMSQASTSVDGYLGKTDWTTFNGKLDATSTPAAGDITGSFNAGLQIGAGAISNADINAAAAIAGTKINPDFGTQNITTTGKTILNTVSYGWPGTQGAANTYLKNDGAGNVSWAAAAGGITSVSGTSPIVITNPTTTPAISINQATTLADGYLSKTDWASFNAKLDLTSTPAAGDITGSFNAGLQLGAGVISNADVNAAAAIAGTKINPDFGAQNITTTGKTILNTVSYTWPGTQGAASTYLKNDGAGNVTWATVTGGSPFITDKIIPKGNGTTQVASLLYDDGTNVGLGTITPAKKLDVNGDINISSASGIFVNSVRVLRTASATFDTFVGEQTGVVSTGGFNSFFGWQAGGKNTSGTYNTFLSHAAGYANTTGSYDVYVGADAGFNMITGDLNTFLGFDAGYTANGVGADTFIGNKAGYFTTTGSFNAFLGEKAGYANTTGAENTFIGRQSGATNTTGQQNTLLGSQADVGSAGLQNATAIGYGTKVKSSNTVALGNNANVEISNNNYFGYLTTDNYTIDSKTFGSYALGWASDSWNGAGNTAWLTGYAGIKLFTDGSNAPRLAIQQLGNVGINTATPAYLLDVNGSLRCFAFTNSSDIRWKKDIVTLDNSLNKILRLRGVEYSWKKDAIKDAKVEDGRQIGFIAQEVEAVIPDLVSTDKEGYKSVKYANVTAVLVEAMKEQQTQIETLKKTIEALEAKLKLYETKESNELAIIRAEIKKLTEAVGLEASAEKK